jgi:hypothetical protein
MTRKDKMTNNELQSITQNTKDAFEMIRPYTNPALRKSGLKQMRP